MSGKKDLPKRDPGKEAEKVDEDTKKSGAAPRKDAKTKRDKK